METISQVSEFMCWCVHMWKSDMEYFCTMCSIGNTSNNFCIFASMEKRKFPILLYPYLLISSNLSSRRLALRPRLLASAESLFELVTKCGECWCTPLILVLMRQRQEVLYEFMDILVYIASSRPAGTKGSPPVSKRQKTKQNKTWFSHIGDNSRFDQIRKVHLSRNQQFL